MTHTELKFTATRDKGEVSAILIRPDEAKHLLVLGHGASTSMRHATMQRIAEAAPALGRHLARAIKTGFVCSYDPNR